jgi:hypothetical protein
MGTLSGAGSQGIKTPKPDMDLIKKRFAEAEYVQKEATARSAKRRKD